MEKLLTKSAGLSDTLAVYDKLTNVIAEIESYQGKLNQMDQLIDYTTFTVCVKEVERETMVDEQNWFAKTWNDFTTNLSDVGNGLLDFASFVLAALPYWILIALVVAVMIFIVRRAKKRKAQKHLAKQAETSEKTKA